MKNFNSAAAVLALCGLVSLGMASCPKKDLTRTETSSQAGAEPGSTAKPQPPQRVYDTRFGITLIVPQDWKVTMRKTNPIIFAVAPGAGTYGPMANVVVERVNQRMDPYDYMMANIPAMRTSLPGLDFKQGGVESAGATSTAWIHYTYPREKITVEAIAYCRMKDYKAYVVTTIAPAEMFEEQKPLFRTIGRSLRID